MRKLIFGDIHGCLLELKLLINEIDIKKEDELYFIGDLIDKGPDSLGVVKYVYELSLNYRVILILGNHEEKFLRYLRNKKENPKALKDMIIYPDFTVLEENLTTEELNFLHNSYYSYKIQDSNILLMHGGLPLNFKLDFSINYQYSVHSPKTYKNLDLITKTRFLDPAGNFVSLGQENDKSSFWASGYDGRFGKILFGHQPFYESAPQIFKYAIGLDLGCVFGGYLLGFIIEDKTESWEIIKALNAYSTKIVL